MAFSRHLPGKCSIRQMIKPLFTAFDGPLSLIISANAALLSGRLLAGAITLIFFTHAFVNMGMVSGIPQVVGVPLPFLSYGGTAMVTLGLGAGILMSIQKHRKLVQT